MKDIKGYEGLYAITSCGKVWSYRSKKFLKAHLEKGGYMRVSLCRDYVQKNFLIHRLVAEAYIPNPNGLPQINHKDEDKTHNYISNLEWCDASYNSNYGNHGKKISKALGKPVYCVELDKSFDSASDAARELGLYPTNVSKVCRGGAKTTGGYHFKYLEVI